MFNNAYKNKTVLITGNTGFKGSWLTIYLLELGASVIGYSLEPPTDRNIFARADLANRITHIHGDVRNQQHLTDTLKTHQPDFIFHMAAQPLVLASYDDPVHTFDVNVMGSIAVMEATKQANITTTLVMITTDKVYENYEWVYSYRENDPLGGYDPYSASKAAMEIAVSSYNNSFFSSADSPVRMASVRSGNVIGGGDWAHNRIIPDCVRALSEEDPIAVRNPNSIRPWQHVLEPLTGYLWLGAKLAESRQFSGAWNFGPTPQSNCTVKTLVETMIQTWGAGEWQDQSDPRAPHEANLLKLSIDKAISKLGWHPVWPVDQTIHHTVNWYRKDLAAESPQQVYDLCVDDIRAYLADAKQHQQPYTA